MLFVLVFFGTKTADRTRLVRATGSDKMMVTMRQLKYEDNTPTNRAPVTKAIVVDATIMPIALPLLLRGITFPIIEYAMEITIESPAPTAMLAASSHGNVGAK